MSAFIPWLLVLAGILCWDYKFSRPAKFFKALKEEEPETYKLLHKDSVIYPSVIIKGIISNNEYRHIKSEKLKKELLDIGSRNAKYVVLSMYVFVVFILISLLIGAIRSV